MRQSRIFESKESFFNNGNFVSNWFELPCIFEEISSIRNFIVFNLEKMPPFYRIAITVDIRFLRLTRLFFEKKAATFSQNCHFCDKLGILCQIGHLWDKVEIFWRNDYLWDTVTILSKKSHFLDKVAIFSQNVHFCDKPWIANQIGHLWHKVAFLIQNWFELHFSRNFINSKFHHIQIRETAAILQNCDNCGYPFTWD